ncbi:stabilin-2-like [Penaeus japonicus]|uniref:stabilin-2-like n=1 Tax=Penaeus japonicus TaxID=27405 RepID=UPI001C713818|nr:stabilin-2-like [Penaeus japonicus]
MRDRYSQWMPILTSDRNRDSNPCAGSPLGPQPSISDTLSDINECLTNNGGCDVNADCTDTDGSYTCTCKTGYTGDGFNCSVLSACGSCNRTIIVSLANYPSTTGTETWSSPNYPSNYPDGCVCCLFVELQDVGTISFGFNSGDKIFTDSNCAEDRLVIDSSDNTLDATICDDLDQKTHFMIKSSSSEPNPTTTACFIASFGDGNTVEKGFEMTLTITLIV